MFYSFVTREGKGGGGRCKENFGLLYCTILFTHAFMSKRGYCRVESWSITMYKNKTE